MITDLEKSAHFKCHSIEVDQVVGPVNSIYKIASIPVTKQKRFKYFHIKLA